MYLSRRPVVVDMCVIHPVVSSAVVAAAWAAGASAAAKHALKWDKHGRTGTCARRFIPLSHEMYGSLAL